VIMNLLSELENRGHRVTLQGKDIHIRPSLSKKDVAYIRTHKAEIIEELKAREAGDPLYGTGAMVRLSFPDIGDIWLAGGDRDPGQDPADGIPVVTVKDLAKVLRGASHKDRLNRFNRLRGTRFPVVQALQEAFNGSVRVRPQDEDGR